MCGVPSVQKERGREGGREGGRERGREGERERGREGERERERERVSRITETLEAIYLCSMCHQWRESIQDYRDN